MSHTLLAWLLSGALVLAALAVNAVRVVPAGERLVRVRRGRHRVLGPGLAVVLPGLDREIRVPLRATWVDVLFLDATTRDGVPVTVNGAALVSVTHPVRYALAADPPGPATVDALEAEIGRYVGVRDLAQLAEPVLDDGGELTAAVNTRTAGWGVEVARVELTRIEVRLGADLLRWAEGFAARGGRGLVRSA
ncbi:MAG TPA: SPFH domain-containing protein [Pseudonocardia sp.]|jgi:regulator of protease activity HflC (stomatin/prohibitin superfamily)|uniref:SPFH domain-containing protein n=1 Tax=Pseudonocardia sp. TaxID=60912 RepID=UPI002B4B2A2B|nr:SPFH domain-containing protein [Pseudonocardia sp.]HLU58633.1 SPFH domain-containing protein [Pseudonocardia sp.]